MNSRYIVIFVAIATISTIGAYTYNEAMASHAFEGGTAGGALPIATTVIISGEVMQSGDYMPLVDFSPNFVAGHLLLRIPCDAEGIPRVFPVAGHIDEMAHRTYTSQPQMNLIEHVSNKGKTCVYHSHVPNSNLCARVSCASYLLYVSVSVYIYTKHIAKFWHCWTLCIVWTR